MMNKNANFNFTNSNVSVNFLICNCAFFVFLLVLVGGKEEIDQASRYECVIENYFSRKPYVVGTQKNRLNKVEVLAGNITQSIIW